MCNHFYLLLEVLPMPADGISDEVLLTRLSAIYGEGFVAGVSKGLADATVAVNASVTVLDGAVAAIRKRFTYRMQDLGEFMKGLLQRSTQWFNRAHFRTGRLWEDRFKSVIVEDGVAPKTISAYIDLNPVRAAMVKDPAAYRWSSYGEAISGGSKGNGKMARAGLVRALRTHQGIGADADSWAGGLSKEYRRLLVAGAVGKSAESVGRDGQIITMSLRKGILKEDAALEREKDGEIPLGMLLRCRIRYFTDGAVLESRSFVDEAFIKSRERFGPKRKTGARRLRGDSEQASGVLWSLRNLRRRMA